MVAFLVIGYDIRVWEHSQLKTVKRISFDASVWKSVRNLSPGLFCQLFEARRVSDISNGLNLSVIPSPNPPTEGYVQAAFTAPSNIVKYMSESFGLQHSLEHESSMLIENNYCLLGFDIVDLWTQFSALYHFPELFDLHLEHNKYGLLQSEDLALQVVQKADEISTSQAPFQPVGVWVTR